MIITNNLETLQQTLLKANEQNKSIALVPTMGALHQGHASLIKMAREVAEIVVVSIFVNPRQFGKNEDFTQYPRTIKADEIIAKSAGADIIYTPDAEEMYPHGFSTNISAGEMGNILCGKFRSGHFDGVATVVTKLLLRIMPHFAIFGMKDYQQLCIIERVVNDLDIPVSIIAAPIIREESGLALSSRNTYLSEEEQKIAPLLYKTLKQVATQIEHDSVKKSLDLGIKSLTEYGFKVDYLELCDGETLMPLSEHKEDARILAAAWLGKTRLIDNIGIEKETEQQ